MNEAKHNILIMKNQGGDMYKVISRNLLKLDELTISLECHGHVCPSYLYSQDERVYEYLRDAGLGGDIQRGGNMFTLNFKYGDQDYSLFAVGSLRAGLWYLIPIITNEKYVLVTSDICEVPYVYTYTNTIQVNEELYDFYPYIVCNIHEILKKLE